MNSTLERTPVAKAAGAAVSARRTRKAKPTDRATKFAHDVLAGVVIAGPHVRDACTRHLRDLEEGAARGLIWSVEHATEAIAFFEEVLCLNGGDFEGQPFLLDGWQAFVVGSIYGWLQSSQIHRGKPDARTAVRRFLVAYVETAKGSGKSPLAAGVGMKGLTADGENRAEIYAAATKKDQAMVLFRDAVAMYQHSPDLRARLTPSGAAENIWNLAYRATTSFFRPISADDGASGPRPHVALIDEYHEHKTNSVYEFLRAGTKSRRQALMFMITNSGAGKSTPCGIQHDYACDVAAGRIENDEFFAFVCGLDKEDDPFAGEACWPKANPSLQFKNLPGWKYLRGQVTEARGMPSKEALVRRLNFCQWTAALSPWLSAAVWDPCRQDYTAADLHGRRAFGGLDLSSTTDICSFTLLVEPLEPAVTWRWIRWAVAAALHAEDPEANRHPGEEPPRGEPYKLLVWCWLPEGGPDFSLQQRADRDRVDYPTWRRQGYLEVTPGAAISKRHVAIRVSQICQKFEVQRVSYDRWRIEDFKKIVEEEGIPMPELVPFGQGFKEMSPALDEFETAILNRFVAHNGHPVLTWCASNAVTTSDPAGNRKLDKIKATGRIDAIVSSVMAYGGAGLRSDDSLDDFLNNPVIA